MKDIVPISYADANTQSVMRVLISFNTLIDTDFGLLVLIAQKFFDTSVFKEDFFKENNSIHDMKMVVYKRYTRNPLDLCIYDKSNSDDYYNQFMEKYYQDILDVSMITDFAKSLNRLAYSGANFTILCENEAQVNLINSISLFDKYSTLMEHELLNLDDYNQFFFKDYKETFIQNIIRKLRDKKIYIGMYEFNKIQNLDKESLAIQTELFMTRNIISLIDLYKPEG